MGTARLRILIAIAALGALAGAAQASALTRYASPAGLGAGPCTDRNQPCALSTALVVAQGGDTVRLLAGTYLAGGTNVEDANLVIEGEPGSVPTFDLGSPVASDGMTVSASNVTFRNVRIVGNTGVGFGVVFAAASVVSGLTLERVVLRQTGGGFGVVARNLTVRNSVISTAAVAPALEMTGIVVGSTVVADGDPGARAVEADMDSWFSSSGPATLAVRNSILIGGVDALTARSNGLSPSIAVDVDYSASTGLLTPTGPNVTLAVGTHNVSAAPQLVNRAAATDVHQVAGSPTIDAGTAAAAYLEGGDIDGDFRHIGGAPDIGADEFEPAPTVGVTAPTGLTTTGATFTGSVNPNGNNATYFFEYGPTTAYGSRTPDRALAAGTSASPVAESVTNLPAGGTIHVRLVATNGVGTTQSSDLSVTLPADPAPVVGVARLLSASVRTGQGASVRFSLSEQARVVVVVDRIVPGRVRSGVCRVGLSTGRACTRFVRRATFAVVKNGGSAVRVTIPARLAGRALAPGRYRLTITARDLVTGAVSNIRRVVLTVTR